jgi:hypothetical protein
MGKAFPMHVLGDLDKLSQLTSLLDSKLAIISTRIDHDFYNALSKDNLNQMICALFSDSLLRKSVLAKL